jgi:hypothetical protein
VKQAKMETKDDKGPQQIEFDEQDPVYIHACKGRSRQEQILNMKDDERQVLEKQLRELARPWDLSLSSLTYPVYILRDSDGKDNGPMSLFEVEEYLNVLHSFEELAEQHARQVGGCFGNENRDAALPRDNEKRTEG